MIWEQALTPTLEQTLNMILSALANFFGTTTETIMQNAPTWLAKYGWYVTLHNEFVGYLLIGVLLGVIIAGIFLYLCSCIRDDIGKGAIALAILIFVIVVVIAGSIPIITCMIAPEIIGLEAAIKLISG